MPKSKVFSTDEPITATELNKLLQDDQILPETGQSSSDTMSQKATTENLDLKADKTTMISELAKKADKTTMAIELDEKADKMTMEAELAKKANAAVVEQSFANHVAAIALKADKTTMAVELDKKADKTTVETQLGGKVDKTTQINGKALNVNIKLSPADIGAEPAFSKNSGFNKAFGSASGTVCQGNDSRLTNSRRCNNTFDNAATAKSNLGLHTVASTGNYSDLNNKPLVLTKADILNFIYPVGSIKFSTTNVNPSTYLGGTWIPWGSGRVPVGVDVNDAAFDSAEKNGGEKMHQLTINEMPRHNHLISHNDGYEFTSCDYVEVRNSTFAGALDGYDNIVEYRGFDRPHNNLQPYITCYMFKRTL